MIRRVSSCKRVPALFLSKAKVRLIQEPKLRYFRSRVLQTARRSTGGKAPHKQLATKAADGRGGGDDDEEGITEDVSPKIFQLGSIKVTSTIGIVFKIWGSFANLKKRAE